MRNPRQHVHEKAGSESNATAQPPPRPEVRRRQSRILTLGAEGYSLGTQRRRARQGPSFSAGHPPNSRPHSPLTESGMGLRRTQLFPHGRRRLLRMQLLLTGGASSSQAARLGARDRCRGILRRAAICVAHRAGRSRAAAVDLK